LGLVPEARSFVRRKFLDANGAAIDAGIALFFPAPRSFTGEDVLELHAHGAPIVVDLLLKRVTEIGARLARPGEFSERAFLNGKLDLAQAEAIADLIGAGSEAAARSALRSLQGEFSQRIRTIVEALTRLRMYVEAAIDFPEEEIDFLSDTRVSSELASILASIETLFAEARQGSLLQSGMTIVLAGAPNAGKSSLLNALAGEDTAIVNATPGTTRDIVRSRIDIDGMPVHVLDTAGLRASADAVEQEGIGRARAAMQRADRVLVVIDDSQADAAPIEQHLPATVPRSTVYNKIDLSGRPPGASTGAGACVAVSAKTGAGLDALRAHLRDCVGFQPAGEGGFIARRRHLEAIERAREHIVVGQRQPEDRRAGELLADDLRRAQQALGEITGEFTSEDLLHRIFSSFCIGK
jgi:tRNA modification GTPase